MSDDDFSPMSIFQTTVPARAKYIGQFIVESSLASFTFGITGGQLGIWVGAGPIIPFLAMSWIGVTSYTYYVYNRDRHRVLRVCQRYPDLLKQSLLKEFPEVYEEDTMDISSEVICNSFSQMGYAIVAAYSIRKDIDDIHEARKARIVEAYSTKD